MLYKIYYKRILLLSLFVCFAIFCSNCEQKKKPGIVVQYPRSNQITFSHPYLDKANCFYRNNFDSAIFYYKQAAVKLKNEGNWEGTAGAFNLIGSCFTIENSNDSALYYLLRGKDIATKKLPPNNIVRFRNTFYLGVHFNNSTQPETAFVYFKTCEDLLRNYFAPNHPAWSDVYSSIGEVYLYSLRNFQKAEEYYTKALIMNHRIGAPICELGNNIYYLSSTFRGKGDYFKALQYNRAAFNYFRKANLNSLYLANCYIAEGNIYHDMDSTQLALKSYRKAIHLKKKSDNINWEIYYNDLASGFIQSNQPDSAKYYARQSLKYNPSYKASNWFTLGQAFCIEKNWDSSEIYLRKSLSLRAESFETKNPDIILTYFQFGNLYSERKNSDSALNYYQHAICLSVDGFTDLTHPLSNPAEQLITEGSMQLLNLFYAKALELENKYNQNKNNKFILESAFQSYMLANYVIELNRKSYQENESKLFLVNSFRKVYDHAINCAYQLNQLFPEKAYENCIFDLMEKTKYALLLEDLFEAGKQKTKGISIEPEEKKAMRSNQYALNLAGVQHLLKDNQEILEYYWGDQFAFIMGITRNKIAIQRIENKYSIESYIKSYIHQLTDDLPDPSEKEQLVQLRVYTNASYYLYSNLIEKVVIKDILNASEEPTLIVTPDGVLSSIPFESFTTQKYTGNVLNYKTLSYLIKQYHVTYSYSSNILFGYLKERDNEIQTKPLFLGLFDEDTKSSLVNLSQKRSITSSGDLYFKNIAQSIGEYNTATMGNLMSLLKTHDVIQLNVHGVADRKDPSLNKLVLKDSDLYFSKVLNLNFKNKIMLLTACETGVGKQYKGEGVYSLTRAFIYAGCSSVVTSLWKIPEDRTLNLMQDFYSSLLSGKSTDMALTIAKRKYLDKSDNITSHPRFWTGLVSVGNLKPVHCTIQSSYKLTVLISCLILGLAVLIYIRSTRA